MVAVLFSFLALFYRGGHYGQTDSHILGETRGFKVFLPASYNEKNDASYPVVYSLDGEKVRHGELMAANARMLAFLTDTPEVIIVAVYTHGHRTRDFAPDRGAPAFTQYLGTELRPLIDAQFRTSGQNVISGHSYGGLYALYAFAEHPGLFDAHFAFVPSVFHYEGILEQMQNRLNDSHRPKSSLLLVSGAESQRKFWRGFDGVVKRLQEAPNDTILWDKGHYPLPHPLIMLAGQIDAMLSLQPAGAD